MADSPQPETDAKNAALLMEGIAWQQYYAPRIRERCFLKLNELAHKKSDEDDVKRGWVQALNWALTFPQHDIEEQRHFEDERAQADSEAAEHERTSERGFRSPFVESQGEH